jgi:c-di-GMP-binding flagellar brake protein YcgR
MASSTSNTRKQERRHLRFVVAWAAHIQTPSGQLVPLRVIDISPGGIGVVSDNMLPATGAFGVTLRVPVPGNPGQISGVNVQARVIHQLFAAGGNRAGLEFVDIAPAVTDLLIRCAQKRA